MMGIIITTLTVVFYCFMRHFDVDVANIVIMFCVLIQGDQAAAMSRKNSAPSFVFWQQLTVVHVVTLLHQLISRLFINAV